MLNKQLCAIFGIDEFNQWLMKQLDYIEDQLYASDISSPRYIELRAKHQALKDARDAYWAINKKQLKEDTSAEIGVLKFERDVSTAPTYKFEIIIFDQQDDPSRFHVLSHHFDYLCPLDLFPDVTIFGVEVNYSLATYKVSRFDNLTILIDHLKMRHFISNF